MNEDIQEALELVANRPTGLDRYSTDRATPTKYEIEAARKQMLLFLENLTDYSVAEVVEELIRGS